MGRGPGPVTGPSERPSRQPLEKRKAHKDKREDRFEASTYGAERAAIVLLYAAKLAAARLYAPRHQLQAITQALKAEEQAALRALREEEHYRRQRRRLKKLAWGFSARSVSGRPPTARGKRPKFGRLRRQLSYRSGITCT